MAKRKYTIVGFAEMSSTRSIARIVIKTSENEVIIINFFDDDKKEITFEKTEQLLRKLLEGYTRETVIHNTASFVNGDNEHINITVNFN